VRRSWRKNAARTKRIAENKGSLRFQTPNECGGVRGFLLNLLGVLLVLALAALWVWRQWGHSPANPTLATPVASSPNFQDDPVEATDKLLKALNQKLQDMDLLKLLNKEVEVHPVTLRGKVFSSYIEWFREPPQFEFPQIDEQLKAVAQISGAKFQQDKETYSFKFTSEWEPVYISFEPEDHKPKICVIIDDGGYQKGEALKALYDFKIPVTVSIIPDVQFSKSLAEEFPDHGVEVMCHMPMEGHEKGIVGGNYKELLKKGMGPDQAKAEVEKALENLPHCRGLNNHMGSVATEDPALMSDVCEVLKAHGLFIIDSRTTAKSMMETAAKKEGVPVARRNVFLDNVETPEAILKQLDVAAAYAKRHRLVVAIGHFKPVTLQTLESAIPKLKSEGFQFVYASEVVKVE
jgi:uncharacterized protein